MRVWQPLSLSVLIPAHLFFFSLPNAVLSSSGLQAEPEANHAIAESSSDTTGLVASWASFLNPSHVVESIKGVLLPLGPNVTTSVQPEALAASGDDVATLDFWDVLKKNERIAQDYVPKLLNSAAAFFDSTKFTDIMSAMHGIVNTTATFHDSIQGNLRARGITLDMLTLELEGVFTEIAKDLQKIPLPDSDKPSSCSELVKMVDKILDKAAAGLENLFQRLEIEEGVATGYIHAVEPHILALVVTVCGINGQYPSLFPALAFSISVLLIPQGWILRPFLSLLGFGPAGPIKGFAAPWLQRMFWGAAVKSGSWFAWLQAAGMGTIPMWADIVAKVHLLVGGLFAMVFRANQDYTSSNSSNVMPGECQCMT